MKHEFLGFFFFFWQKLRKRNNNGEEILFHFFVVWKFSKIQFAKLTHVIFSCDVQWVGGMYSLRDAVAVECDRKGKSWNIRSPNVLCSPLPLFSSLWLHSLFTFDWSFCFCASFWTPCIQPSPFFQQLSNCYLAGCLELILYVYFVFWCDETSPLPFFGRYLCT